MASAHTTFDESLWVGRFPLERLREEARDFVVRRRRELPKDYTEASFERHVNLMMPKWRAISRPEDLSVCIQLRWENWPGEAPGDAAATDVFVWCEGEPSNRALTKIGGLPYWPQGRTWPDDGEPMVFVGQFNFADSVDIVPPLPGTILTVFVKDEEFYGSEYFHFEWVDVSQAPLVQQVPVTGWWSHKPVYGQRHRTWDHPSYGIHQATKIGGLPFEIQGPIELPGAHLATLHSLGFASRSPHPFANRETALTSAENRGFFGIGDAGSLYLFLDEMGRVHAEDACY